MVVLVVSDCSGEKQFPETPNSCAELVSANRKELVVEYAEFALPSSQMYTRPEHSHVREVMRDIRDHSTVSWCSPE